MLTETADGELVSAYVFNAVGVLKGAELLGKHLAMFTDKVAVKDERPGDVLPELSDDEAANMLADRIMEAFAKRQIERANLTASN